jgi:hypothetical protein
MKENTLISALAISMFFLGRADALRAQGQLSFSIPFLFSSFSQFLNNQFVQATIYRLNVWVDYPVLPRL